MAMLYARDLMTTQFDTIHQDELVENAIQKILNSPPRPTGHKSLNLMVVDDDNTLVGTISMYYILYHLRPPYLLFGIDGSEMTVGGGIDQFVTTVKKKRVCEIMNPDVLSVEPDDPIISVIDRMIKNHLRRISVVEKGKLIGVVYLTDIFYDLFAK
ncbi:MAG: HPP family protein [Desulfobulbus sp.]|jgi:CBS domain-containing protein